ncbi:MAG: cellulose biosynthesis cyclic di-GMP-binding regulatory protein BcsB, partial [Coleofasciculaceae cyanobacterium]
KGLEKVQQVIKSDPWFFQLREDTVLVAANDQDAPSYQADAFKLEFLESAPSKRRIENTNPLAQVSRFLQENWFLLPLGMIAIALLLYGIAQLYLKRFSDKKRHN